MQKNAFHEIWTWLSRKVLQGIRVDDCNRVPETPSDDYIQNTAKDRNQRKKG